MNPTARQSSSWSNALSYVQHWATPEELQQAKEKQAALDSINMKYAHHIAGDDAKVLVHFRNRENAPKWK